MNTIGITQRVEEVLSFGERRDCLDQNWFVFLEALKLNVVTIPNSLKYPISFLKKNDISGLILSGGNDIATFPEATNPAFERDRTEYQLLEYFRQKRLPVIGVCRGLQLMNIFLKGNLIRSGGHVGQSHKVNSVLNVSTFNNYKKVNSFHNFVLPENQLGSGLIPVLRSKDGFIEAVQHEKLPWIGIMWHPEREHPFKKVDKMLFTNHFYKCTQ